MVKRIIVVVLGLTASVTAAQLSFDFSNLDPTYWTVVNPDGLWTVGIDNGTLRITHPASATPDNRYGGVLSRFVLVGDFDVRVDYIIEQLPIPVQGQEANQAKLHMIWGNNGFLAERSSVSSLGEIEDTYWYTGPQGGSPGYRSVSGTTGKLRLTRTDLTLEGFAWDGTQWVSLGSHYFGFGFLGDNSHLYLMLQGYNNQSDDQIDIRFDNLSIQADQILLVPEPAFLGVLSGLVMMVYGTLGGCVGSFGY